MKRSLKLLCVAFCVSFTAVSGQVAYGQCGAPAKKVSWSSHNSPQVGMFKAASFTNDEETDHWDRDKDKNGLEPIVGLWKIAFVDAGKNYSDTGYAAWHSDFTEFQNSERTPSTGAVCQGVWEKIGRRTFRLNHFALAYMDSTSLSNVIRIKEVVKVDAPGKHFAGAFITDVYDTNHNLLVQFRGSITGTRVTIDSDIDSQ